MFPKIDLGTSFSGISRRDVLLICGSVIAGTPLVFVLLTRINVPVPASSYLKLLALVTAAYIIGSGVMFLSTFLVGLVNGLIALRKKPNNSSPPEPWKSVPFRIVAKEFVGLEMMPETIDPHSEEAFAQRLQQLEKASDFKGIELLQAEKMRRVTVDWAWWAWYYVLKSYDWNPAAASEQQYLKQYLSFLSSLGLSGILALASGPQYRHWSLWLLASVLSGMGFLIQVSSVREQLPAYDNVLVAEMLSQIHKRKRPQDAKEEKSLIKKLGL